MGDRKASRLSSRKRSPLAVIEKFKQLGDEIEPGITHVWGAEGYLVQIALRGSGNRPVLVSLQGIVPEISMYAVLELMWP